MGLLDDLFDDIQKENSENINQTKGGLPKLTTETLAAFKNEMSRQIFQGNCLHPILEEWCKELEAENPVVLCYIQESVSRYHPDMQRVTFFSLVMLYQLLKSQASNDKVFEYFSRAK